MYDTSINILKELAIKYRRLRPRSTADGESGLEVDDNIAARKLVTS